MFVTATGDIDVLTKEHFSLMKDGAIMCNTGHFNVEINLPELEALAKGKNGAANKKTLRPEVEEYTLPNGKRVIVLAEGRLVNLACAKGHPSEVMDMSFANQSLCTEYLAKNAKNLKKEVYDVPADIDETVARLKLQSFGAHIDVLSDKQKKYLASWSEGT
ncbi:Adenosylhomocysteinase [uncultured archaeon]|nr:Adenosylhomocysteinase [uncultured archaeon]